MDLLVRVAEVLGPGILFPSVFPEVTLFLTIQFRAIFFFEVRAAIHGTSRRRERSLDVRVVRNALLDTRAGRDMRTLAYDELQKRMSQRNFGMLSAPLLKIGTP